MPVIARSAAKALTAAMIIPMSLFAGGITAASAAPARTAPTGAADHGPHLRVRQILFGGKLSHTFTPVSSATKKTDPLTGPDDITMLDGHLFTGFQNGVGSQGEASTDGNLYSTVVEFTLGGREIRQWDVKGKVDGLGVQPGRGRVIATVNEDANSSVYTISAGAPRGHQVEHYRYNKPLPHNGGTDSVSTYHGQVLISASAPGTVGKPAPQPTYPAVYAVRFNARRHIATVRPVFFDEALARVANVGSAEHGKVVRLKLVDPDSNEVVPGSAPRFAGDFMLTSQADQQQIFLHPRRHGHGQLSVLNLSQAVDDTAWATYRFGLLYAADATADTVDVIFGGFRPRSVFVAVTPCDAGNAPSTCPAPGFPPNYLGALNPWTGKVTRVPLSGPDLQPKGLIFVSRR